MLISTTLRIAGCPEIPPEQELAFLFNYYASLLICDFVVPTWFS